MAYRTARMPVTLSDLEGHCGCYNKQHASLGLSASPELRV